MDKRETKRHPIQVASHRTGLSADLLRTWERRYGAVTPGRTRGRHRLYSDADIERLRLLREATDAGRTISLVASLTAADLEEMLREDRVAEQIVDSPRDRPLPATVLFEAAQALERIDSAGLARALAAAAAAAPDRLADELVVPVLQRFGRLWTGEPKAGRSVEIRLVSRSADAEPRSEGFGPRLVVGAPERLGSELVCQMVTAAAIRRGWSVVQLGPGVTTSRLAAAGARAQAVALVLDQAGSGSDTARAIRKTRSVLEAPTELLAVVGRNRADRPIETAGVRFIGSIEQLESRLVHIRQRPSDERDRQSPSQGDVKRGEGELR